MLGIKNALVQENYSAYQIIKIFQKIANKVTYHQRAVKDKIL